MKGRRVHQFAWGGRADLRPPRRRHAAADHQETAPITHPTVVAGLERCRSFFARGSGRPAGHHLADPRPWWRASLDHRQHRRWMSSQRRFAVFRLAGKQVELARRSRRGRCAGDRSLHRGVLLATPLAPTGADSLPARRWRSSGSLLRRRRSRHLAPADARQRPDSRPDMAARQQRCRLQLEPRRRCRICRRRPGSSVSRGRRRAPRRLLPTCRILQPDMHRYAIVASRMRSAARSLAIPDARTVVKNVRHAVRITRRRGRCRRRRSVQAHGDPRLCRECGGYAKPQDHYAGERRVASDHLRARAGRWRWGCRFIARRQSDPRPVPRPGRACCWSAPRMMSPSSSPGLGIAAGRPTRHRHPHRLL